MHKYKVTILEFMFNVVNNGIELDTLVNELIKKGANTTDIKIEVLA